MINVVIIHTVRGGRDPEEYAHVVTEELAQKLDPEDPWARLGGLEDSRDSGILKAYLDDTLAAKKWAGAHGCKVVKVMDAPGY